MLLSAFLEHFADQPAERYRTLAASTAGSCARRLAYGLYPEFHTPEPMTPRRRARLHAGREYERMILGIVGKQLASEFAGETAFLWPIPVDHDTMQAALTKADEGRIVAHVLRDMNAQDIGRYRSACESRGMTRFGGIVLDPAWNVVLIPALSDGITDLSKEPQFRGREYAMATLDFKTLATSGFRLGGSLDYGYRTQFAIQADAANLDTHIGLYYRLETSHAIEVVYSRRAEKIAATFWLSNGQRVDTGDLEGPREEWDEATVEHPFEPALLDDARARIRRVLRSTADTLPEREYGPDFTCPKCRGTGQARKCGFCTDAGITKRSLTAKSGPKSCKRCKGLAYHPCGCTGGRVDEAELKFPCGWCPYMASCWSGLVRMELPKQAFGRPHFLIRREDYERSGITYQHPEGR